MEKEIGFIGKALRGLGALGGGTIGTMIGQSQAGSAVGSSLGAALSRWLGAGDYTVSSNSIVQRSLKGSDNIPAMHSQNQTVVIRHKEYLGEIRGSTGFQVQQVYSLNPGLAYTFPWLSTIAAQFSEYRFKGIVFHYVPTSGATVSGSNPAIGSVMLQTTYRATDSPPASKVEMLNEYWACEAAPNESFCHPIECDPKENPFSIHYTRTGTLPSTESQLMYDLGETFVATSGQPANGNVLGDLWVTYEVELRKPVVASSVSSQTEAFYASTPAGATLSITTWFSNSAITTGGIAASVNGKVLTFPKGAIGTWLVTVRFSGSFTAMDLSGEPTVTNCSTAIVNVASPNPVTYTRTVLTSGSGAIGSGYYQCAILISDPQLIATVGFPGGSATGIISAIELSAARVF